MFGLMVAIILASRTQPKVEDSTLAYARRKWEGK